MIAAIIFTALGGLMILSGASAIRRPVDDTISIGEALAHHISADEVEPKPRWLKIFERFFHFMLVVFGGSLMAVGISGFFSE